MSKTLTEVTRDAAELPVAEKLKLARILLNDWEPSEDQSTVNDEAWDAEINRRLEELRGGRVKGVPLSEVKKKIEAKFRL